MWNRQLPVVCSSPAKVFSESIGIVTRVWSICDYSYNFFHCKLKYCLSLSVDILKGLFYRWTIDLQLKLIHLFLVKAWFSILKSPNRTLPRNHSSSAFGQSKIGFETSRQTQISDGSQWGEKKWWVIVGKSQAVCSVF